MTVITAHSGCDGTDRDSIAAIEAGIALGADCVEIDVRPDESGALYLSHDARSGYKGAVRVEDALKRAAQAGICINCDLKQPEALYPLLSAAADHGLGRGQLILSGSVSCDLLAADASIARRAQIYLNIEEMLKCLPAGPAGGYSALPWEQLRPRYGGLLEEYKEWLADNAVRFGAAAINMPFEGVEQRLVEFFRSRGAELSVWTVNAEEDIARFVKAGVKNITTLNVRTALRVRAAVTGERTV